MIQTEEAWRTLNERGYRQKNNMPNLLTRQSQIDFRQREILAEADQISNGVLTAAQDKEYKALQAEYEKLDSKSEPQRKTSPNWIGCNRQTATGSFNDPFTDRSYTGMFGKAIDTAGFENMEDYFSTVHAGRSDQRLDVLMAAGETYTFYSIHGSALTAHRQRYLRKSFASGFRISLSA